MIDFPPVIYIRLLLFSWKEWRWKRKQLSCFPDWKKIEKAFDQSYFRTNPYTICKKFLQSKTGNTLHFYGETPLSVFTKMFLLCGLPEGSTFIDLGAGRGKGVFFAACCFSYQAIGIEEIPTFVQHALLIQEKFPTLPVSFLCADICQMPIPKADLIYLYNLAMSPKECQKLYQSLETISSSTFLICVSEPLPPPFTLIASFPVEYPWGKTLLYIHKNYTHAPSHTCATHQKESPPLPHAPVPQPLLSPDA